MSAEPVVERFRRWGIVAWATIGILILTAVMVWAFRQVDDIFPPLVLALVTIYILNPFVQRLEAFGVPRLAGSCLAYVVIGGLITLLGFLAVPTLVRQGREFAEEFPHTAERVTEVATDVSHSIERRIGGDFRLTEWLGERSDLLNDALNRAGGFLTGAAQTAALLVIGLVLGFYLLLDLPRLSRALRGLIPPNRRDEVAGVASTMGKAMGGFFRGQLVVALLVGVMSAVALRILGLPYWLMIGLIAGFFNLVPLIGPFVGAIPAILVALAFRPPITVLWVAIALTIVQQIDNHLISPNVMRWTVRLHPVTVMLSLIVGAALAGFWGMLLAVPVTASGKVVVAHLWRTHIPWGGDVFEDIPEGPGPVSGVDLLPDEPDGTAATPPGTPPDTPGTARPPGHSP